jgi:hypothetical protein
MHDMDLITKADPVNPLSVAAVEKQPHSWAEEKISGGWANAHRSCQRLANFSLGFSRYIVKVVTRSSVTITD